MNIKQSESLYKRACEVIPGGVNSPVRAFRSVGGTPIYMKFGDGCWIEDADGNRYLDFCNSWGPLISGHRHPEILNAIQKQIAECLTLGTPCEQEVLLAEHIIGLLQKRIPDCKIQKIRFTSSGTEAVMSAIRLARGFTGRNKILKFNGCYHGHSDGLLVKGGSGLATLGTPDSAGVPESFTRETIVVNLDDVGALKEAFREHGKDLACVIIEPVPANNGLLLQTKEFLQTLRTLCDESKSILIFDEVISGFRVALGGAAEYYGVSPDMVTYGKIVGGGMPVGAFAGRNDIFAKLAPDGPVYQAGTLSGNPVAMSAGLAQLRLIDEAMLKKLENLGKNLEETFNNRKLPWTLSRIGSIFWFHTGNAPTRADQIERESMATYAKFHRHCLNNGVYLAPSGYEVGFLSSPMTESDLGKFAELSLEFFSAGVK